jgi:hypothetical protein
MPDHPVANPPVVSEEAFASDEPMALVQSNIDFLNALFGEHLRAEEVPADGLRSYYADYWLAQVNNGGFSQFVYNARWNPQVVSLVREGLEAMGAREHLALFEQGARLVQAMGQARLEAYFASEYFGDNPERDALNAPDDAFFALEKQQPLLALNAAWLRAHPDLVVLSADAMQAEAQRRGRALPDRVQRIAAARAAEPRYLKLIRALCQQAGQDLDRLTAADPAHEYEGQRTVAFHFLTDRGHHHMIDLGDRALMFEGRSTTDPVAELRAPEH